MFFVFLLYYVQRLVLFVWFLYAEKIPIICGFLCFTCRTIALIPCNHEASKLQVEDYVTVKHPWHTVKCTLTTVKLLCGTPSKIDKSGSSVSSFGCPSIPVSIVKLFFSTLLHWLSTWYFFPNAF